MRVDQDRLYRWIGSQLRERRKAQGITQIQLAKAVDVRRTSITNIESGIQKLPISLLFEICEALRLEPTEIIPSLDRVRREGFEEVVIDEESGQSERIPPQTANAVRDILASIQGKNDK